MKLCRFNNDRLGLVEGDQVIDVTQAMDEVPALRWPIPIGDPLIVNLARVRARAEALRAQARRIPLSSVTLYSPVANPGKILGIRGGFPNDGSKIPTNGYFIKALSSLIGPGQGIELSLPGRQTFHEMELAVVIGQVARRVPRAKALDYIAGYMIGLDCTLIGEEERSTRKSLDSHCVLGPWMVTSDEFGDPQAVEIALDVNGQNRQKANTRDQLAGVAEQIEIASAFYTLHPGDVILTGNPDGSAALRPGDVITARIERIGEMQVQVRGLSSAA